MTLEEFRTFLGWCCVLNMGILLWWGLWIMLGRDFVYRMHSKWFKMSEETFDSIHYIGMAMHKIILITFFIVPYFALLIVGK